MPCHAHDEYEASIKAWLADHTVRHAHASWACYYKAFSDVIRAVSGQTDRLTTSKHAWLSLSIASTSFLDNCAPICFAHVLPGQTQPFQSASYGKGDQLPSTLRHAYKLPRAQFVKHFAIPERRLAQVHT